MTMFQTRSLFSCIYCTSLSQINRYEIAIVHIKTALVIVAWQHKVLSYMHNTCISKKMINAVLMRAITISLRLILLGWKQNTTISDKYGTEDKMQYHKFVPIFEHLVANAIYLIIKNNIEGNTFVKPLYHFPWKMDTNFYLQHV